MVLEAPRSESAAALEVSLEAALMQRLARHRDGAVPGSGGTRWDAPLGHLLMPALEAYEHVGVGRAGVSEMRVRVWKSEGCENASVRKKLPATFMGAGDIRLRGCGCGKSISNKRRGFVKSCRFHIDTWCLILVCSMNTWAFNVHCAM